MYLRIHMEKNTKYQFLFPVILLILATAAVITAISARYGATTLTTARYTVETELEQPVRIVQLSDLHSHVFGNQNDLLVDMVEEESPDLILMTGDMMDKQDENADVVCALIEELVGIAPVYYGYGNHEADWISRHGNSLESALTEAGAIVLDVAYTDTEVNGQALRLGGYHGYYRQPGMYNISAEQRAAELAFADHFEDTERYKILLCHIPTAWIEWEYINRFPVDLVLTGHYHGGQIRLPLIGGVYAPYIGLFPEYTEGMYQGAEATAILSTGLGSRPGIPRINNLPQIVVVDLLPESK